MQIRKPQLQRQQVVMAKLGFYRFKCDGIWGPESIKAKRKWESDPSFIPALPNNGLPFGDRDPLPKGMSISRPDRLLTMRDLTDEEEERFLRRGTKNRPETEQDHEPAEQPVAAETETEASEPAISTQDSEPAFVPEPETEREPQSDSEPESSSSFEQRNESQPSQPAFGSKKKKRR